MKRIALLIVCIATCFSCNTSTESIKTSQVKKQTPKNIIFLIGDGMGLSQVSASIYNKENPNFEKFPVIGLSKTSSSNELITDSAAGATAFSIGKKTYNGAIGVDKDTIPVETIFETISKKDIATGVIATSSIVHATPASFFAHSKQRRRYEEIATFLPNSGVDFFAGGGLQFFNKRKDNKDLLLEFEKNGFKIDTTQLPNSINEGKHGFLLAENGMPKMLEGRGDFLQKATELAISSLNKNQNGFMLVVEGSQIDWGGHDNDADYLISELLDFDETLGAVLDFAEKDGETLVVVTADHETGGFTLASNKGDYNDISPSFSTGGHSGTMVPVFAYGPGSENFGGIYENTAIYSKLLSLFQE